VLKILEKKNPNKKRNFKVKTSPKEKKKKKKAKQKRKKRSVEKRNAMCVACSVFSKCRSLLILKRKV